MTDLTIGAPTAMHRICEAIDNIHSTAISHSRAFVLEVMGRHCGWLTLMGGVRLVHHPWICRDFKLILCVLPSSGADFIFIPERPPKADPWEDEMCEIIHRVRPFMRTMLHQTTDPNPIKHREIGKRKTIVIVAEGAHDANLKPIRADYVKEVLTNRLRLDTRVTTLGHIQRGGKPCAWDRILVRSLSSYSSLKAYSCHLADAARLGCC